jgi:hypothetical protein
MLATPPASDWKGNHGGGQGKSLRTDIYNLNQSLLPTPKAQNRNNPAIHGQGGMDLQTTIGLIPTPCAGDNRDRGNKNNSAIQRRMAKGKQIMLSMEVNSLVDGQNRGLKLHSDFVLWMMGFPEDWCDLKDGEQTPSKQAETQ